MSDLDESIQYMKGIGPKKSKYLQKLEIYTIKDLLYTFPREYQDRRVIHRIADIKEEQKVAFKGMITGSFEEKKIRKGLNLIKIPIKDCSGVAEVIFFNAPFIKKAFKKGDQIFFYGKAQKKFGKVQIIHPEYEKIKNTDIIYHGIYPIYPLTYGLTQKDFTKWINTGIENYIKEIKEYLPQDSIKRNRLCHIQYALENIHRPSSIKSLKVARFRLVFEELFIFQLGLWMIKNKFNNEKSKLIFEKKKEVEDFISKLPFQLTNAQKKVLQDMDEDMKKRKIMNRLVQGDVGSGKTIVSFIAIYKTILNGYQGVLMAPTEILAEQHYREAKELLEPLGVKIELLSGSVKKKKKEQILDQLQQGKIHMIIGTHALIEENVKFQNLGMVITDEQHRFGVRQRNLLSNKGEHPHVLVMTATPIPRTLALILYGDLDISIIDELPPGRKKIKTRAVDGSQKKKVYDFCKNEIIKGRQIYIVAPLVEESEKIEATSAQELYTKLKNTYLKEYSIGLLHGKMKAKEKEQVMNEFKKGNIKALVATTVIEVGVNVPNASVMVIENSERFGLAQLHQLRGRVGRGAYQSYCMLINESKSQISKERMDIMQHSNNGFIIAEKDLQLRGPGEFFGTRQHGLPQFKIANLLKHMQILKLAQKEAEIVLKEDMSLDLPKNQPLKIKVKQEFNSYLDQICL